MKKGIFIAFIFFLVACSAKKNTFVSRNFHNLTAHYNVYFNGNQSFKEGEMKSDESFKDDYSHILPIFKYGDKEVASSIGSQMNRTLEKSTKCIKIHSIKAKPKKLKSKKTLTAKEKEFYEKNEYNKWIDDAYMLIGKSHFYKMDYSMADEAFQYVVKENKEPKIQYKAYIWMVKTNNQMGEFNDSKEILTKLETKKEFKELLKADFYEVYADYYLKQKQYREALDYLEKAVKKEKKKKLRTRLYFIMAQVYQESNQLGKASEFYRKVIKMNPSYEMAFSAKINRATSFVVGVGNSEEIKKELKSMLKDDKNIDYQDQIYFALGNIAMKENKVDEALDYYKKSALSSVNNDIQKTTSFLSIADIYFNRKDYKNAGIYYDSSSLFITERYPDYSKIKDRTKVLTKLVVDLNTIYLEDSLQNLAKMPEKQREEVISKAITKYEEEQRQIQLEEMQAMQQRNYFEYRIGQDQGGGMGKAAKWYFYNPTTINMGKKEFSAKWGKRPLEDNWRRKNKEVVLEPGSLTEETDGQEKKKSYTPNQREFYLQHIPLSDSLIKISHDKIKESLFSAATIYREELKEYKEAIKMYEELVKRYPDDPKLSALTYFHLYRMYSIANDKGKSDMYKNIILSKYPGSIYETIIMDPNYLEKLEEIQNRANKYYESTYQLYKSGQYSSAIANADNGIREYEKEKDLVMKFKYIRTLSSGKTSDVATFKSNLRAYIEEFPNTDASNEAKQILVYLDKEFKEVKVEEEKKMAEVLYTYNENEEHYYAISFDINNDANQVVFNLINFNLDSYDSLELNVNAELINENQKVTLVKQFKNKNQATLYLSTVESKTESLFGIINGQYTIFIISKTNYEILVKDKSISKYYEYYKSHYNY